MPEEVPKRPGCLLRKAAGTVAALLSIASLACGTGLHYRPRDWRPAGPDRWAVTFEEMDIETSGVVDAAGSSGLRTELTIHNASLAPVSVVGGRLETGAGVLEASRPAPHNGGVFTIPPGETERLTLLFPRKRPAGKAAAEPVTLVVSVRTAGGPREISIPLRKG